MNIICEKRCIIGEGPIWNEKEQKLYFTNGMGNEVCILDICSGKMNIRDFGCAAFCFDKSNKLIVSTENGVYFLNEDNTTSPIYDTEKYNIKYCNDMKVGPDGRIYVGTQSGKRKGVSDQIDGKLYSIDKHGNVCVLLDNLILSNGLEWSMDEKKFYHTDSDTQIIKEYTFDKERGTITYTGREVCVMGVDGFTLDQNDFLYVACWGQGHIAVVDTSEMRIVNYIDVPAKIPASCAFAGNDMNSLIVVTATLGADLEKDENAGCTFVKQMKVGGRKPYLFG